MSQLLIETNLWNTNSLLTEIRELLKELVRLQQRER